MTTEQKFMPVLFLIVGIAVGFVGGKIFADKNVTSTAKYAEIKTRLIETGALIPQPLEVKRLAGSIKAIKGNTLTVALSYPRDPFGDSSLDERTVTIDSNTKIAVLAQKDQKAFEKELADYQSKMSEIKPGLPAQAGSLPDPSEMPTPPQLFDKKDGDLSSLKVGQMVDITTAVNVKDAKKFIATTIEISALTATAPAVGVTSATPAVPPPPSNAGVQTTATVPPPPPSSAGTGVTGSFAPPPPPATPSTNGASTIPPPSPPAR